MAAETLAGAVTMAMAAVTSRTLGGLLVPLHRLSLHSRESLRTGVTVLVTSSPSFVAAIVVAPYTSAEATWFNTTFPTEGDVCVAPSAAGVRREEVSGARLVAVSR